MKKLGLLVLVLVLALASLGIGYAAWSSSVTINGTVETGTVLVGVVDAGSEGTVTYGTPLGGGWYNAETITVSNAYPGAAYDYNIRIGNEGTVPVNFTSSLTGFTGTADTLIDATFIGNINGTPFSGTGFSDFEAVLAGLGPFAPG